MVHQHRQADGTLLVMVMTGEDEENKGSHVRIPIFGNAIFNSTMKISVDAHMDMIFQGCDCNLCGVVIVAYIDDTDSTLVHSSHFRHHEASAAEKGFHLYRNYPLLPFVINAEGLEWLCYNVGTYADVPIPSTYVFAEPHNERVDEISS